MHAASDTFTLCIGIFMSLHGPAGACIPVASGLKFMYLQYNVYLRHKHTYSMGECNGAGYCTSGLGKVFSPTSPILHSQPWNDVFIPYLIFLCMCTYCTVYCHWRLHVAHMHSYIHSIIGHPSWWALPVNRGKAHQLGFKK